MNNKMAIQQIRDQKASRFIRIEDFLYTLEASKILKETEKKIAIVGRGSQGKTFLIQILSGEKIDDPIKIPVILGNEAPLSIGEAPATCKNNNVVSLKSDDSFWWDKKGRYVTAQNTSLREIQEEFPSACGLFKRLPHVNQGLQQIACLLVAPDITDNPSYELKRSVFHTADVSDILVFVGLPSDFTDGTFDFILDKSHIMADKKIIAVIIHREKSCFFHYPFKGCKGSEDVEKKSKDGLRDAYNMLRRSSTSDQMKISLKDAIVKDTENLIKKIEEETAPKMPRINVHATYFIPTEECESKLEIKEDLDLIERVNTNQHVTIYEGIIKLCKIEDSSWVQMPYIAWEYFFRKTEDICSSYLTPHYFQYIKDVSAVYFDNIVLNRLIQDLNAKIEIFLRDYDSEKAFPKGLLEEHFESYRQKQTVIAKLTFNNTSKDTLIENIKKMISVSVFSRISQQFNIDISFIENEILEKLKSNNIFSSFDVFYKTLSFSQGDVQSYIEKFSPIFVEKERLDEKRSASQEDKTELLRVLNEWIVIAETVFFRDSVSVLFSEKEKIKTFVPG